MAAWTSVDCRSDNYNKQSDNYNNYDYYNYNNMAAWTSVDCKSDNYNAQTNKQTNISLASSIKIEQKAQMPVDWASHATYIQRPASDF